MHDGIYRLSGGLRKRSHNGTIHGTHNRGGNRWKRVFFRARFPFRIDVASDSQSADKAKLEKESPRALRYRMGERGHKDSLWH